MNLLCLVGRHRWATVERPGEVSFQSCERCLRYRSSSRWRNPERTVDRGPSTSGGAGDFGGGGGW